MRAMMLALAPFLLPLLSTGAEPVSAECTVARARPATVAEIARDPTRWNGSCVRVSGTARGLNLFHDVDGIYLRRADSLNPASNGGTIGLDNYKLFHAAIGVGYRRVTLIGRVQDCEEVRDSVHASAAPDEIVMISGYCHSWNGPYLWVTRVLSTGPSALVRQFETGRAGYGDLTPVPANWPHRAFVEQQIARYVAAVGTGDRRAFAALHSPDGDAGDPDGLETATLAFDKAPWIAAAMRRQDADHVILQERDPADDQDDYGSTICVCRGPSCAGRWPIDLLDADNDPARPYVCTRLTRYVWKGRTFSVFATDHESGLREPGAAR